MCQFLHMQKTEIMKKIIRFVNEIMEEGGIKTSTVTNSGNIVIDSLIGYWYVEAKKVGNRLFRKFKYSYGNAV